MSKGGRESDLGVCQINRFSGLGRSHALVTGRLAKDGTPLSQSASSCSYSYPSDDVLDRLTHNVKNKHHLKDGPLMNPVKVLLVSSQRFKEHN